MPSYPRGYVKKLIENFDGINMFFENNYDEDDFAFRSESTERFVCAAKSRVIFPQSGQNAKNQWKFIFNQQEDGYVQGVRVEECAR